MKLLAQPISGLDERFISSKSAERSFHNASVVRVAGAGDLRLADGTPNMGLIAAEVEAWSLRLPRLRQRLLHAPGGLIAPAWVPERDFRTADHLRLHPVVLKETDVTPAMQNGGANGELDMRLSPWNVLVVDLGTDILLIIKMHHVMGDGMSGVSTLDALLTDAPDQLRETLALPQVRAPENFLELAAAVWSDFCTVNPTWAERRSAVFAKAPTVRVRKVIGRNLRRLKAYGSRVPDPQWRYGVLSVDVRTARMTARVLGGSLTDLVAAAGAQAVAEALPGRRSKAVTIAVPVSEEASPGEGMGNRTRVVPVTLLPGTDWAASVASVRAQSRAAIGGGLSAHLSRDAWDAMATFLPAGFRPRYFAGQLIRNIMFWTSLDPTENVGILSSNYLATLNVTVVAAPEVDMDALLASLRSALGGAGSPQPIQVPLSGEGSGAGETSGAGKERAA